MRRNGQSTLDSRANRRPFPRLSHLAVLAIALLSHNLAIGQSISGPLRVSEESSRYFRDASGKVVYLAGSQGGGWDIQDDCWSGYRGPNLHIRAGIEKHP